MLAGHAGRDGASLELAEQDLREAVRLLEPLAAANATPSASQDLGRAYNNLGTVVAFTDGRLPEARGLYTRAVALHEGLTDRAPRNREYAMELIQFYNNLSDVLQELGAFEEARTRNAQALERIESLARPAPSVGIERADSYNLRGRIYQVSKTSDAVAQYRRSLELFSALGRDGETRRFPEFHQRAGDLLVNLAVLEAERPRVAGSATLLDDALRFYIGVMAQAAESGAPVEARSVLDTVARVTPELTGPAAEVFTEAVSRLRARIEGRQRSSPAPPAPGVVR
jgi:tetratricopeptide (TPR) repeat protein